MVDRVLKMVSLGILMLVLAVPLKAQNTKGDKPTATRESRFKKSTKKTKPAKRVRSKRTTSSLRAYTPRKKSKGGERAGRPASPLNNSRPSERPRNTYPQSGVYVHNPSKTPKKTERIRTSAGARKVTTRSSSQSTRNVYPQSGRYVNHSSTPDRTPRRNRKVIPRSASRSFTARRSLNAWTHFPRPRKYGDKPFTKDIAGRRIRTKNFETRKPAIVQSPGGKVLSRSGKIRNVYPQSRKTFSTSQRRQKANVYPQFGGYTHNPLSRPQKTPKAVSNKSTLARLNRLQGGPDKRPGRKQRVTPRSASASFIKRRSTNTWAHFPRPKHKGERAVLTDIAGRPLRTKNFETQRPKLINPTAKPDRRNRRFADRPYQGGGNYRSSSRSGKAWRGDVTNRRIRKNYTSKLGRAGKMVTSGGGGSVSGRSWNNRRTAIPPRSPGIGANGIEKYSGNRRGGRAFNNQGEEFTGNIKARRSFKGGGSISGKLWNNNRRAIPPRSPGIGANGIEKYQGNRTGRRAFNNQGEEFSGNIKARRPFKGGGSVSGRVWNNNRKAIPPRSPGIGANGIEKYQGDRTGRRAFNNQGEEFSGNIKARRPFKGGGSVSGKLWNNKQTPVAVRTPVVGNIGGVPRKLRVTPKAAFGNQGEEFSGNIKSHRPAKGGGSVSGKLWNNRQAPIAVRVPVNGDIGGIPRKLRVGPKAAFSNQGEEFSGNIKSHRPAKGGGSVSGKLWNNKQTPIPPRTPERSQGEEFSGNIKSHRPAKGGGSVSGKLWNNKETPIAVRVPKSEQGGESSGNIKLRNGYVKNPNSAEAALKKRKPSAETYRVGGLQVKVQQRAYGQRKNAPDGALPGLKPSKASIQAGEYTKVIKSFKYVRNPNSSDDALKVREPGKAFARSTDYQGNIKMKKFDLFGRRDLHPDAQFVKLNKNNVAGEKDMLTNFKLWWSRLFRKNETQPDHLKDKRGKPRYDKGETGLWYD
jgi:hypothetical protein